MFLPQLVQDVGRVEASVVAQLPCDHLNQIVKILDHEF